jgi:cytochrome c biogenesis factor
MRPIWDFLLSLKTAFGLFLASIAICVTGSLILPANLAFFSGIDDTPLFRWLSDAGEPGLTWWIYVMIAMMGVLALSTIICTADALLKMRGKNLIAKLSPQVMHAGILLVLLGHLLSASMGSKADVLIRKGEVKPLSGGVEILLNDVGVETDEAGYYTDWMADIWYFEKGKKVAEEILRPAHPLYFGGLGLYFKTINVEDNPSALIRVCRDPGALWALLGGALVGIGGLGFLYGRFKD